ncbi:hypothetical protein D3C72_1295180 [compost metagenome]
MVQDDGPQVVEDAPGGAHGGLGDVEHAVQVGLEGGRGAELAAQPVQVELEGGEGGAEVVVDVAGDVGAFFFAQGAEVGRQAAQGFVGGAEFGGAFADAAFQQGLGAVQFAFDALAVGDV